MADPEIWKALIETGNPYVQQERQQKGLMGMMLLQEKQREMESAQRLRDLYASGQPVSTEKVMAIDPMFGQKMQQFNNEQLMQKYKMLESQGNIEEQHRKSQESKQHTFANTLGVGVENWIESLGGRQPTAQDIEAFKPKLGGMLKFVDETYGYKPDVPIDPYHPEQILSTAESLGYASRRSKTAQEAQLRNIPPQMSPQQYYGEQHTTPEGYVTRTPGMGGQMPQSMPQRAPQPSMGQEDITEPQLQAYIASLSEGPEKQRLMNVISRGQSMAPGSSSTVEVTPDELQKIRQFNEAEKVKTTEEIKQNIQEKGASKKATMAYEMLPSPDRIRNLIKGSISGDVEYWANRLGGAVGKSLEAGDMTGALKVIEGQMADTVAMFPGAQSDKELEARMKTIGDPSAKISPDTRLAAFNEWLERMQKYASQHAEYDDTQLLDMVKDGKLNADQAMKIRKRRMSGGL